jgi:ABC-type proline/glycine betaine transport system permease subunit
VFFADRTSDFMEMLMHHIAAVSVLLCMVFSNWISIGCTIAYLHDIADITAGIAKFASQTRGHPAVLLLGALLPNMAVWAYTRNYLLAVYLYKIWTEFIYAYPPEYQQFVWVTYGAAVMLTGMLILHYYWFTIFI